MRLDRERHLRRDVISHQLPPNGFHDHPNNRSAGASRPRRDLLERTVRRESSSPTGDLLGYSGIVPGATQGGVDLANVDSPR